MSDSSQGQTAQDVRYLWIKKRKMSDSSERKRRKMSDSRCGADEGTEKACLDGTSSLLRFTKRRKMSDSHQNERRKMSDTLYGGETGARTSDFEVISPILQVLSRENGTKKTTTRRTRRLNSAQDVR